MTSGKDLADQIADITERTLGQIIDMTIQSAPDESDLTDSVAGLVIGFTNALGNLIGISHHITNNKGLFVRVVKLLESATTRAELVCDSTDEASVAINRAREQSRHTS